MWEEEILGPHTIASTASLPPVTSTAVCLCLCFTLKCLNHQDLDVCEEHDFLSILLRFNGGLCWHPGPNKNSGPLAEQLQPGPGHSPHTALGPVSHQEHISRHPVKLSTESVLLLLPPHQPSWGRNKHEILAKQFYIYHKTFLPRNYTKMQEESTHTLIYLYKIS